MESIKCSAKDIDIYIFLPAHCEEELADLIHSGSTKDFLRLSMSNFPHAGIHHP